MFCVYMANSFHVFLRFRKSCEYVFAVVFSFRIALFTFVYVRLFCLFKVKPDLCEWMESLVRISMNKVVLSIQVYKRVGAVIQQQHETIAGRFLWSIKQFTEVSCCASETLITSSWTCLGLLATFLFAFFFLFFRFCFREREILYSRVLLVA